eukprot:7852994-Alexandrium_andersonii.AAC.1
MSIRRAAFGNRPMFVFVSGTRLRRHLRTRRHVRAACKLEERLRCFMAARQQHTCRRGCLLYTSDAADDM